MEQNIYFSFNVTPSFKVTPFDSTVHFRQARAYHRAADNIEKLSYKIISSKQAEHIYGIGKKGSIIDFIRDYFEEI